jgi:hypothetical protein
VKIHEFEKYLDDLSDGYGDDSKDEDSDVGGDEG